MFSDQDRPACPFCASTGTERLALFGQFLLSSQYYCRECRSAFDVVRWADERPEPEPSTDDQPRAG